MKTVDVTEFERNFDKYADMAQREELVVTKRKEVLFKTVLPKADALLEFESLLNILPADASIGVHPNERG